MDNKSPNWLDTEKLKTEFKDYLELEENSRIIFSGVFGAGKTTFLDEFFINNQDYLALHLFPVNYSVASTEDIFELIKVDVLHCVLCYKPPLEILKISIWDAMLLSNPKDQYAVIKDIINLFGKIGKTVDPILTGLETLLTSLKTAITNSKETIEVDQAIVAKDFFKEIELSQGSIYERNIVTELITELIEKLKRPGVGDDDIKNVEKSQSKEIVLIVDDLDRIDPEHIFRLLNVFGAHFDSGSSGNKFGIDKVIFCCDIRNVRNIFHHKYGIQVDFNGYINKFYSRGVFYFDNRKLIEDNLNKIIYSIKFSSEDEDKRLFNRQNFENAFMFHVLRQLVKSHSINLRVLMKFVDKTYVRRHRVLQFSDRPVNMDVLFIVPALDHLVNLFGDYDSLISAIEKASLTISSNESRGVWFLCQTLLLADADIHRFNNGFNGTFEEYSYRIGDNTTLELKNYLNQPFTEPRLMKSIDFGQLLIRAVSSMRTARSY